MKKTIVFDLDDTLVKEIDYLQSAFRAIAESLDPARPELFHEMMAWYHDKQDVFGNLEKKYREAKKPELIAFYRNHFPDFDANSESRRVLMQLKAEGHHLGLVSDGYSVTQRNKIRALGIEDLFDLIVISEEFGSEKPDERNFAVFSRFEAAEHFYISDNLKKDFIAPNRLGWTTICLLDDGRNIHGQDFNKELVYLPTYRIKRLGELPQRLKSDSWDY